MYCVVVKSGENSQQQRSGQVSLDALLAHSNHSGHGRTADCIEKNHRVLSVGLSIAVEGVWGKDLLLLLVFTVHMSSTTLSCRLLLGVDGQKEGDLGPREEIGPPTDSNSKAH